MKKVLVSLLAIAVVVISNMTTSGDVVAESKTATAVFAGGCFWCVESDFDAVEGVLETVSGYAGGATDNPTYKNHHQGMHREVVQITYDPAKTSFDKLLHVFWRSVDPTDAGGQFCDRGHSYTTAVYAVDDEQYEQAMKSRTVIAESSVLASPIETAIEKNVKFWPAEGYHQNYYNENPIRYKYYRTACGRDKRVKAVWGAEAHAGIMRH